MKNKELNLLEKQRKLEKKRDEAEDSYQSGIIGGILFLVLGAVTYFALPQIVKGKQDEQKFLKYQVHITLLLLFIAFVIFALGYYWYLRKNKIEKELEKIKKELGE